MPTNNTPLLDAINHYLDDLHHANRSAYTYRDYRSELRRFADYYQGSLQEITADTLRGYFATMGHLAPATRSRREATIASFFSWAVQQDLLAVTPMTKIQRVHASPPRPRGVERDQAEAILAHIPRKRLRDHLLFRFLLETGIRIGEALQLHVEDLDLSRDNEHVRVLGKGRRQRIILLDDPSLVKEIHTYLRQTEYQHGPLFRATKNGTGGPIRYQSIYELWQKYCQAAGVACTPHQLRHAHATELINAGVSLQTIRKRLGHQNIQTTLRYAEQADAIADDEVRSWRRNKRRKETTHG